MHYALLPVLPLVLLIVFSPMVYDGIKLSLQTGLIVSIIIAFVVDFITRRSFRESTKNTQAVFEGMGKFSLRPSVSFAARNSLRSA